MKQDTTTPPKSSAPAASAEKKALLDAFDTVLKTQAEERDANLRDDAARKSRASSRPLMAVATAIILAVGGYLAVAQPAWVFAPRPTPESLALKEASLRVSMANAVQHIERYRKTNARLPATLAEAGARIDGLRYDRLGPANFRLAGENGPSQATYTSGEELSAFLGNSYQIIARRTR